MHTMKKGLLLLGMVLVTSLPLTGAMVTWVGSIDTDYANPGNWDTNAVPATNGTDDAFIGGATIYNAGPDFSVSNGSTVTIGLGGSWTQTGGISWIQAAGGTLNVNSGGSFDMGTSGNLVRDGSTVLNIAGNFTYSGLLVVDPGNSGAVNLLSGGLLQTTSEFKPIGTFQIPTEATMSVGSIVSFSDGAGIIEVNGTLEIGDASLYDGFYGSAADRYTTITSLEGSVLLHNATETTATNLISTGAVRYLDGIGDGSLVLADLGGGDYRITAVPEPSTFALFAGVLVAGAILVRRRRQG